MVSPSIWFKDTHRRCCGLMVSVLVLEWAVRERALGGDIVLCSWARHFTLIVPASPPRRWVLVVLMLGKTLQWTSIPSKRGAEILLVASRYRNRDKLPPDRPLGSYADLTYTFIRRQWEPLWRKVNNPSKTIHGLIQFSQSFFLAKLSQSLDFLQG